MSPPLRATFSPAHPLARRAVPVARARAFQSSISLCLSLGEWPRLPVTARIERPLFHRGGSASKTGTWPLPAILLRPRVARAQGTHRAIPPLLAALFSILLEIHPELDIGPVLIGAGAQVLRDIPAGEHVAIDRLEGQLAIHKQVRPSEVHFFADVPLVVVRL